MTSTVKQLVDGARGHQQSAEWVKAAELYQQALDQQPQSADAILGLAQLAFQLSQHSEAKRLCLHLLDLDPKHIDAWMLLGAIHEGEGQFSAALNDYQTLLTFEPDHGRAHLQLGRCLVLAGRTGEGLKHLIKATMLMPQSVDAHYALGLSYHVKEMPGPALKSFLKTIEVNPTFLDGYLTIADLLAENRRWADARKILQQAESLFPDSTLVLDKLAAIFLHTGDIEDAISCVQDQIEMEPNNLRPYLNLSMMAQLDHDWETALEISEKMVEHAPEHWESHYHLAAVLDVLDKVDSAKASYNKAMALDPDQWRPPNNLGYLLLGEQTQESYEASATLFRKAMKLAPEEEPTPRYNLALSLVNLGNHQEAIDLCLQSLSVVPHTHELYASLQQLHEMLVA